jgi:hypothetical protein
MSDSIPAFSRSGGKLLEYKKAMVTYLDILGFSELINESKETPAVIAKIQNDLINLKKKTSDGGLTYRNLKGQEEQIFHSYNFSDLTVRCTLLPEDADLNNFLSWELLYIGVTQERLLQDGVILRGGICSGEIAAESDSIVFGPALVKAYWLESEHATYPRVVIDRLLLKEARNQPGVKYWSDHVSQSDDGTYFLDYLYGTAMFSYELRNPEVSPLDVFGEHRKFVVGRLETDIRKKAPRIRQKYMWLARYHNSSIERFNERMKDIGKEIDARKLAIGEELLDF